MQKIQIDQKTIDDIVLALLSLEGKIQSFHIGITNGEEIDTFSYESTTNLALNQFTGRLKEPVRKSFNFDEQGSTVRIKAGSFVIGCYSPARREIREALALVYAFYCEVKEQYGSIDVGAADILLLRVHSWQQKHFPNNSIAVRLAEKTFKPEALKV